MDPVQTVRPRRTSDLRVDPASVPGWVPGTQRLPAPGEPVYTHEGMAVVVRVLGRTGSAGRLLELKIEDGRKQAYFAAAGNVMVRPRAEDDHVPVDSGSGLIDRDHPGAEGGSPG